MQLQLCIFTIDMRIWKEVHSIQPSIIASSGSSV